MSNKENKPFLGIDWLRISIIGGIVFVISYLSIALKNNNLLLSEWCNVDRGMYLFLSSLVTIGIYLLPLKDVIKFFKIYFSILISTLTISAFITWGDILDITTWSNDMKGFILILPLLLSAFIMFITSDSIICDCDDEDIYHY